MHNCVSGFDVLSGFVGLCVGSVKCVDGFFECAVVVCVAARVAHFWRVEFAKDNAKVFGLLGAGVRGGDVALSVAIGLGRIAPFGS